MSAVEGGSYAEDASFDDWLRAYGDVYEALPDQAHVACPNCGADALRLVFVGDEQERVGYAAFWCDNCRFGIHLSRVDVPHGVPMHPFGMSGEELRKIIPDYTLVVPPEDAQENGDVLEF